MYTASHPPSSSPCHHESSIAPIASFSYSASCSSFSASSFHSSSLLNSTSQKKLTIADSSLFSNRLSSFSAPPHLMTVWTYLKEILANKKIFIFLDYDGTLTPIISDPSKALIERSTRILLKKLSLKYIVSIVTGRALKTIKNFVKINTRVYTNFMYAASHGFHIESGKQDIHHKVGLQHLPDLHIAKKQIQNKIKLIDGCKLEDNEFAVSVHYRNSVEGSVSAIEKIVDSVLFSFPFLKKCFGKKVFEIRLNVEWDKGKAVLWLLEAMDINPFNDDIAVIYIGDDITDEDAFSAIFNCPNGLSILVANENDFLNKKKKTKASCRVDNTEDVLNFLNLLLYLNDEKEKENCNFCEKSFDDDDDEDND